ncbi:hypothetical protein EGW08_001722 [Elysia chlorotica]|uniref:Uncharacterized protein n=1 Tax=Elysia chlorotica TaxID=188477 RepID=A0A433U9K6_ELYCH|nr:hypothetical protein EGW08_001722 [Elysia chlorotica]
MPSNSTILRNRWKKEDPAKYEAYLAQQRVKSKERRDKKKEMLTEEHPAEDVLAQREKEREQTRKRVKKLRERRKAEGRRVLRRPAAESDLAETPRKKPKEMTEEERRAHNAELRRQSRARQNPQKKRWARVKAAQYQREYRERQRAARCGNVTPPAFASPPFLNAQSSCPPAPTPPQEPPSRLINALDLDFSKASLLPLLPTPPRKEQLARKTLYNFTSAVKSSIKKKSANNATIFARIVKNLATPKTPEKRKALQDLGIGAGCINPSAHKQSKPRQLFPLFRKRNPTQPQEAAYSAVKDFYIREDIARILPHKRYASKAGPGYVMLMTLQEAFNIFKAENPDAQVQFTKFTTLRPKNVRLVGDIPPETSACWYCLNVRHKKDAINRVVGRAAEGPSKPNLLPPEVKMLDSLLCPKAEGSDWHDPACIQGKTSTCLRECELCHDPRAKLERLCYPYMDQTVSWQHWERQQIDGRTKLEVVNKTGLLRDLVEEFVVKDLQQPSQNCTFVRHLHTYLWQYNQYSFLKQTLRSHEALLIMDFAENRKASYSQEVKSAHFGKGQITLHPTVCFYITENGMMRHSMMFVTDDIQHDFHAVHHFTLESMEALKKAAPSVRKVYLFSDGCAGQYKGKGSFADLSLYTGMQIQRCFFGSEHGKGEADG